ncbi:MAG TPA: hypothetical protein VFB72_18230 [Verrucomicrobiae bacterium]|nr:hypothetical protein [Verrucomicrobiae bacterium]
MVIYDDLESQSDRIKRRAFYLFANEDRIMRGRRPHYVKLSESEHLQPIPMLKGSPDDPNAGTNEMYGIELSSRRYRLESRGKLLSSFELPQYERWLTAKKLFLFPGAVGADAVGGAAAIGAAAAVTDPVGVGNTVAGALQKH